jgi:hypothetical protein
MLNMTANLTQGRRPGGCRIFPISGTFIPRGNEILDFLSVAVPKDPIFHTGRFNENVFSRCYACQAIAVFNLIIIKNSPFSINMPCPSASTFVKKQTNYGSY